MKNVLCATTLFTLLAVYQTGFSATLVKSTQWTGNNHTYEVYDNGSSLTWDEANKIATGKGGYLATLTSKSENDYIFNTLANDHSLWNMTNWNWKHGPWLGGQKVNNQWEWVTNENWNYTNWVVGEPNGNNNTATKLHFAAQSFIPTNSWDDVPNSGYSKNSSFIVEYSSPSAVPVPAAALLFAPALLGFMGLRRKTKKSA